MIMEKPKTNIEEVFKRPKNGKYLKVAAPMVRYSKLEFRSLVRKYGAELTFSPMTIANSFCRSEKCRQHEFTTNEDDTPMIVQFAANCSIDFLHATEMVQNYSDGVDLNCGCPQSWAMQDGYGSYLLKKPEVIEDMIKTVRRNSPSSFSISVKIRLLNKDLRSTIDFCRKLETLNPTFITIHGRTPCEKSSGDFPVDVEALAEIKKSLRSLPIIFNGDVSSLEAADQFYEATKCDGMMSARSILSNPALFAGYHQTPKSCVQDWINIHQRQAERMTFQNFHHHTVFMMESIMKKQERNQFNDFTKREQCLDFLTKFLLAPENIDYPENIVCKYDDSNYKNFMNQKDSCDSNYSAESSHGQFFLNKLRKNRADPEEFMDNLFLFE